MTILAWALAFYFLVAAIVFGVRESRCRKLMRAMAERIDIQSQLLSQKAERRSGLLRDDGTFIPMPVTLSPKFGESVHMVHAAGVMPPADVSAC